MHRYVRLQVHIRKAKVHYTGILNALLGRYLKEGLEDQRTFSLHPAWREPRLGLVNGGLFSSQAGFRGQGLGCLGFLVSSLLV